MIGIEKIELINPEYTDNIPIFRINEAMGKWKCHRALYRWSKPPSPLNRPPREVFGKGITVHQSKASAVMEAVERYCAQIFPHNNIIYANYEEVQNWAVHPSKFKFPESIPQKCWYCMARDFKCFNNLTNFHEWTWGFSLLKKKGILVPAALVYYPYMSRNGISFLFNDTGGLASGNTIEEAILSGIAEVIERDAVYNVFNSENISNIQFLEFKNSQNKFIKEFIDKAVPPEKIFAFLISNRIMLNIPTIVTFLCYKIGKVGFLFGGAGTHLNPEIALLRALTEMEQQKVRKKILMEFNKSNLLCSNETSTLGNSISIEEIPNKSTNNIKKDIEVYLRELSKINADVIIVNLTHPNIRVPVVRVIVPELISYGGMMIKESLLMNIMGLEGKIEMLK
ncbi:MAG: YcaO-like family protein [Candidatus Jordarchaeaceae archaeon]